MSISPEVLIKMAKLIGAGIGCIGFVGVGIGLGNIFKAMVSGIAQNPSEKDNIQTAAMIGFALTESVALFTLLVIMLIIFVV